jgi:hypothetical protein
MARARSFDLNDTIKIKFGGEEKADECGFEVDAVGEVC